MTIKRSTGLVDKLNGVKVNKVTNGDFESTLGAEWTTGAIGATLTNPSDGVSGKSLHLANSGAAAASVRQDITTVVGRIYKASIYFKKGTSVSGGFKIGTTSVDDSLVVSGALTDAAFTLYQVAFIASATTTRITLYNTSTVSSETSLFDSVIVEEVFDGFIEIMRGCKCNIYQGTMVTNADTAASGGNLLVTVSLNGSGTGLTFTESSNGIIEKPVADTWTGSIAQSGTATWFRFYEYGDDPHTLSTTAARFDGTVGTSSTDMIVGSTTLTYLLTYQINGFSYTAPKG